MILSRCLLSFSLFSVVCFLPAIFGQADIDLNESEIAENNNQENCGQSHVVFDGSAVQDIILNPERVLADIDSFWAFNETFRLVGLWHHYQHQPLSKELWRDRITGFASISNAQRRDHSIITLLNKLLSRQEEFRQYSIPHICSFMPHKYIDFSTTVYFALGTDFSGFAADNLIVISISDPYWQGSCESILNAMTHEVFHVGYGFNAYSRTEIPLKDNYLYNILGKLHNEGLATYVAYKAQSFFPAPAEKDFQLLDDSATVVSLVHDLNSLFQKAEYARQASDSTSKDSNLSSQKPSWLRRLLGNPKLMAEEELRDRIWTVGVERRAFYIVGAFMAMTIDQIKGRDTLVATVAQGPRSFVKTYNSLVEPNMRIYEFQIPEEYSHYYLDLRESALHRNYKLFEMQLSDIRQEKPLPEMAQGHLWKIACMLRLRKELDLAADVYETILLFNPESADSHDGLGLISLAQGKHYDALKHFKKSHELEPERPLAFRMLRLLQ